MNLTVLPVILAVAQPLIQSIFGKLSEKKMRENTKLAQFTCVHSIRGRRRYKSILLKDATFTDALKEKMNSLNVFSSITFNNVTGTMLVTYDRAESDVDEIISFLNEQALKVTKTYTEPASGAQPFGGSSIFSKVAQGSMNAAYAYGTGKGFAKAGKGFSSVSKKRPSSGNVDTNRIGSSLASYVGDLNSFVKTVSSGAINLPTLVGALCIIWGGYKVMAQNQAPNGPQLVWWGYKFLEGGVR